MYVDELVFFSESVPLLRTEEFNMYNVNSTHSLNAVKPGFY